MLRFSRGLLRLLALGDIQNGNERLRPLTGFVESTLIALVEMSNFAVASDDPEFDIRCQVVWVVIFVIGTVTFAVLWKE